MYIVLRIVGRNRFKNAQFHAVTFSLVQSQHQAACTRLILRSPRPSLHHSHITSHTGYTSRHSDVGLFSLRRLAFHIIINFHVLVVRLSIHTRITHPSDESSRSLCILPHEGNRTSVQDEERESRKREALRLVAPGFDSAAPLVPFRTPHSEHVEAKKDMMDDLVDQLA